MAKRTLRAVHFSIYEDQWQKMEDRDLNKSKYVRRLVDEDMKKVWASRPILSIMISRLINAAMDSIRGYPIIGKGLIWNMNQGQQAR